MIRMKHKDTDFKQRSLIQNEYFTKRIMRKYVVFSVISMIFLYAGSIVDTLLVGAFIGEAGLAAMSLISPVYLFYYTFGSIVGIGGSIAASRCIGKNNDQEYTDVFHCTLILMTVLALAMTAMGFIFLDPITRFLARDSGNDEMIRAYLFYYIPGGAMTLLQYIPLFFLKCEGKPRSSLSLYAVSTIINIALSSLFMSDICGMGIGGASLATCISLTVIVVYGFVQLRRSNPRLNLRIDRRSVKIARVKEILFSGTPNGMSNLCESLRILMINNMIIGIGASLLLPCYTVVRNIMNVYDAIMTGVSSAMLPLIGVFFGAREYTSIRMVIRRTLRRGSIIFIPMVLPVCFFPDAFASLFGISSPELISACRLAIPLSCAGLIAAYMNTIYIGYFSSNSWEKLANVLVVLRLIVYLTVFSLLLTGFFGINGIWLSFSLSEIATLATYFAVNRIIRGKNSKYDKLLLNRDTEPDDAISFSVRNTEEDIVFASEKIAVFCEKHSIDEQTKMKISLAIEEILMVLLQKCLDGKKERYVDIHLNRKDTEMAMCFRYCGKEFDPVAYYNENEKNEAMTSQLLGLKLMTKSVRSIEFKKVLGTNSLIIVF